MDPTRVAVILAAGHSTRMGGRPKALTRLAGQSAIERVVDACRDAGLDPPLVVLGNAHDAILAAMPLIAARTLKNFDPDEGRTGSLQVALRDAPRAMEALVWPIDHPLATVDTVRALLATPGEWVAPEHAGRGGHPIVLRGAALDAVRGMPPATPLRDGLRAAGHEPTRVPVDDAGVLANLDDPDALARWGASPG